MDLAGGLCLLAFVLLVLAACGHGMWLVGEAIFRAILGDNYTRSQQKHERCLKCGWLSVENGHCTHCGDVPPTALAQRSRQELQATARQLSRLHRNGQIPYDQCFALLKIIEADLSHLGAGLPLEVWPEVSRPVAPAVNAKQSEPIAAAEQLREIEKPQEVTPPVVEQSPVMAVSSANDVIDAVIVENSTMQPVMAVVAQPVQAQPPLQIPPPQPITPSRTLADVLQAFMQDSNIRWFEVFGGLLIVCCAIGLVISLQATLEYIPYFPALMFMLLTVALHGAGLYTLRRWNLGAVSRAILIIALLLVPLVFTAGVVLPGKGDAQRSLNDPMYITAVLVGLGVFGWVTYSGSRVLAGEGALRLSAAILGCSIGQLIINRVAVPGLPRTMLTGLAFLPITKFLIATLGQVWRAQAWRRMSGRRIEQTFLILGVSLFALLPPIALLVFKVQPHWPAFKQLSPLLCLAVTSILALGIVVHRRALTRSLATFRTVGTTIALIAGSLLIALWVVAWPVPELMLNVSILTGGLLLAVAIRTKIPALHAAAVGSLSIGVVVAFFWALRLVSDLEPNSLQWLQAMLQGKTGLLLTALAAAIGGCGGWLYAQRDRRIGTAYIATAGVLGTLGLLIAGWSGFAPLASPWTGDGDIAGPLFLAYAIALFVIAFRIVNEHVLSAAMALLWIALIQLFWMNDTAQGILRVTHLMPERPVLVATILTAAVLAIMSLVLSRKAWWLPAEEFAAWERTEKFWQLELPLTYGAALAIIAATPFIFWVLPGRFAVHALYASLAVGVWAIVCLARRWPEALAALQGMLAVAVAFAIAAFWVPAAAERDLLWFLRGDHLHAQVLALAGCGLVWSIVRRFAPAESTLHRLLHPAYPPADHLQLGLSVALLTILCVTESLPGIAQELSLNKDLRRDEFSLAHIAWLDPAHLSRLVLGLVVVCGAFVAALADRVSGWKWIGLSFAGWAGIFLLALNWQADIAVASATRWWLAIYGGGLMVLFVARQPLASALKSIPWLRWNPIDTQEREWLRYQSLLLGVAPMLALTIIAVVQNAKGMALGGPLQDTFFARLGPTTSYAGPLLIGVAIFLGHAIGQRRPSFALGGSALFQLAANLAFILHITGKPTGPQESAVAEWLQWNAIAAAIYSLFWLVIASWMLPQTTNTPPIQLRREKCFLLQTTLSSWLLLAIAIWSTVTIVSHPSLLAVESQYLGSWSNLIALGLLIAPLLASLGVSLLPKTWPRGGSAIVLTLVAAVPLVALRAELGNTPNVWIAYHVLETGWLLLAAVVAVSCAWLAQSSRSEKRLERRGFAPHHVIGAILCASTIALAIRGNEFDPREPYWVVGGNFWKFGRSENYRKRSHQVGAGHSLATWPLCSLVCCSPSPAWCICCLLVPNGIARACRNTISACSA
ncbi:hypothetical protein [Anatilimnocola floriformis]|uniref:hypothetical protein n=1 Tax=Anatilimnocola floriformis TaxID=2948575 RepID=UPI0020C39E59|nr:hypothetical protein [Anatilimnocola floriformis]